VTAAIMAKKGVKVYLFPELNITPLVPYATVELHACAGIMITASHNPKKDNGYKVYWENGA